MKDRHMRKESVLLSAETIQLCKIAVLAFFFFSLKKKKLSSWPVIINISWFLGQQQMWNMRNSRDTFSCACGEAGCGKAQTSIHGLNLCR